MRYIEMDRLPSGIYNKIVQWLVDDNIEHTYTMDDPDDIVVKRIDISDEDAIIMRLKLDL